MIHWLRKNFVFLLSCVLSLWCDAPRPTYWSFVRSLDSRMSQSEWQEWVSDEEVDQQFRSMPTHYAYTQFYIQSGGNNANSGTSSTNTIIWQNASTSWVGAGTSTLTVTDSSASAVSVGDYINVGGGWVSKVATINATGAPTYVFTLGGAVGWGTEPATNAAIAAVDGGAWADLTGSIPTGSTTVSQSTQVCIKQGSATGGATAQTVAWQGSSTHPLWFRGYNTTPGDLDMPSTTLTYPAMTFTSTGRITFSGQNVTVSGLSITAAVNAVVLTLTVNAIHFKLHNCVVGNTTNNTAAGAVSYGSTTNTMTCCYISVVGNIAAITISASISMHSCTIVGNSTGTVQHGVSTATPSFNIQYCTFLNLGGDGILCNTTSGPSIISNTFVKCGVSSIKITSTITGLSEITNNYFYQSGDYDINNTQGANTVNPMLLNNVSNTPGTAHLFGFGDWTEFNALSETGNFFVNSAAGNYNLLATSVGYGGAIPGNWEQAQGGYASPPLSSKGNVGAWGTAGISGDEGGVLHMNPMMQW